jgi:muramoyltetrapeptide carboxypeptidase
MAGVEMFNGIEPYTEEHFWRVLTSPKKIGLLPNPPEEPVQTLREGKASGHLLGGNFALVMSLFGTPYAPDFKKSILVLEDIDEAPHRIDRMLMQLLNAGVLKNVAGLTFGKFTDCVPGDASQPHFTVEQVLAQYAERLRVPVISNLQYGHMPKKLTLPFGVRARLDAKKQTFKILEGAVV